MKKYSKKYPNSFLNRKKKYYKKIEIKAIFIIHILIKNVMVPMLKFTFKEIPWAKTLQGDAPVKDIINRPSPNPNNIKPKHKKKNVENLGLKL